MSSPPRRSRRPSARRRRGGTRRPKWASPLARLGGQVSIRINPVGPGVRRTPKCRPRAAEA
eukprot:501480-Lingulodinium_polyedra.AAC.1